MKRIGFKFASAIMVLALIGIISLGILVYERVRSYQCETLKIDGQKKRGDYGIP